MELHVLPAGPIDTNAYLLTAPERGEAVLIDAPLGVWAEVEPILQKQMCRLTELSDELVVGDPCPCHRSA